MTEKKTVMWDFVIIEKYPDSARFLVHLDNQSLRDRVKNKRVRFLLHGASRFMPRLV